MKKLAKKTVVCSMGNLAASGGFYIAVACPKVVAEPGTLTGSIGVITQFPKVKGLLDRWDVKMETVKSGTLKDAGNPFAEMTAEERTYWQSLIDRVYSQFVRAVAQGRGLEEAAVRRIADGRVITGEEAKELKLVDALGNFYDAVELAKSEAKLSGEPHLVYPADERSLFLEQLMGSVAGAAADAVAARIEAPPRPRTPASTSSRADRDPIPTLYERGERDDGTAALGSLADGVHPLREADGLHLLRLPGSAGDEGSREPRRAPGRAGVHVPEPLPLQLRPRDGHPARARRRALPRSRQTRGRICRTSSAGPWRSCARSTGRRG